MNICSNSEAIRSIVDVAMAQPLASPYFFVIGAGVSRPSMPLAEEIIQELRTSWTNRYGATDEPAPNASTMDRYEFWFRKVYLDAKSRQIYLRKKIQGQPIPAASFRLASILADGRLSKLVVTTNFDLFISRALGLIEADPLVYDSADTANERFAVRNSDLQILHVHGTYQYYDCVNLRGEIGDQARRMVNVVDDVLANFSPLVIGYSGWEGDVIMTALRRRLYRERSARSLPYNVYWFCYRESTLETLPPWLKDHPNVYFILPNQGLGAVSRVARESLMSQRESTIVSQPADATLSADDIFQSMIEAVGIPATELDTDPIRFFVRRLKIYIRDIEDHQVETIATELSSLMKSQEKVQSIQKQLHGLHYEAALRESLELYRSGLDLGMARRRELMEAAWSAASSLFVAEADPPVLNDAFDLVIALASELRARGAADEGVQEKLARTLVYQGLFRMRGGDYAGAIRTFDEVIERFEDASSIGLQDATSSALVNKGVALCRWQISGPEDAALIEDVLAMYDRVIKTYDDSPHAGLRESVASALVNTGYLLNIAGRFEESLEVYDEVIDHFSGAVEPSIRVHAVRAMINKAFRLAGNHEISGIRKSIELYQEAIDKIGGLRGNSPQLGLTLAWNGLGFQRLLLAKHTLPQDAAQARSILLDARAAIGEALKLAPDSGMVIGNQAYIEFLLGDDLEYAHKRLLEAVACGGEETRAAELQDTGIFPLPRDAEFVAWLRAAPPAAQVAAAD